MTNKTNQQENQAQNEWDNAFNPTAQPAQTKTYAELMHEKEKADKKELENNPEAQRFIEDLKGESEKYMKLYGE